jgi:signal transduction histidine kinase
MSRAVVERPVALDMSPRRPVATVDLAQEIRRCHEAADHVGAAQLARRALGALDGSTPASVVAKQRSACGAALMLAGDLEEAAKALTAALHDAELALDTTLRARIHVNIGLLAGLCGRYESARRACAAGRAAFASAGAWYERGLINTAWLWLLEADAAAERGDAARAAECVGRAEQTAEQHRREAAAAATAGTSGAVPSAWCEADLRISVLLRLHRVAQARACWERVRFAGQTAQTDRADACLLHAEIALAEGRPEEAVRALSRAFAWDRIALLWRLRRLQALAQAHAALDQHAEAVVALTDNLRLTRMQARQQALALPLIEASMSTARSAREESLAYMVHDVRVPLGRIIATLRAGPSRRKVEEAAGVAERTLGRIDALMQHLRLDTLAAASVKPFDLGDVADDACEEMVLIALRAGCALDREVDFTASLRVVGHRDAMLRAAVNLIDNAIKASRPGGRVRVRCSRRGSAVALSVADDGPGLPAHAQALLAPSACTAAASPLLAGGFGLRYVARVLRMHDARVELSVGSRGSCITLLLQVEKDH